MARGQLTRRRFISMLTGAGVVGLAVAWATRAPSRGPSPDVHAERGDPPDTPGRPGSTPPVLVLTHGLASNPFGPYLGEILRAEGLNLYQMADVATLEPDRLRRYPLTLLTEIPLTAGQVEMMRRYVHGGGALIAMRPHGELASLLGVEPTGATLAEGHLQVDPAHPAGQGIATAHLQFHGEADIYRLAGAEPVAWLYRDATTGAVAPAVVIHRIGQGRAAAWAFDLARSVVLTRQGNPARRQDENGTRAGAFRAVDLFVDWLDLERMAIPRADELQRLLANLMVMLSAASHPLPRLGYLPAGVEGLLVATGDAHAIPTPWIEDWLARVERRDGHASIYYAPPAAAGQPLRRATRAARSLARRLPVIGPRFDDPFAPPAAEQVAAWRARGHEVGLHPYVDGGFEAGYRRQVEDHRDLGLGPVSPTVRTHQVLWDGWVEAARVQATHGVRMNLDYYHATSALQTRDGRWPHGYFTGSALPMKLVDERGHILGVFQQLTALVDEHLLTIWTSDGPRLESDAAVAVSRELLDRAMANGHGPVVAQFHVDGFNPHADFHAAMRAWFEGTLDHAVARGAPIWSAERWLAFVEGRYATRVHDLAWNRAEGTMAFRVETALPLDTSLAVMLPLHHAGRALTEILIDRQQVAFERQRVGGVNHGRVGVPSGSHHVLARYAPGPDRASRLGHDPTRPAF